MRSRFGPGGQPTRCASDNVKKNCELKLHAQCAFRRLRHTASPCSCAIPPMGLHARPYTYSLTTPPSPIIWFRSVVLSDSSVRVVSHTPWGRPPFTLTGGYRQRQRNLLRRPRHHHRCPSHLSHLHLPMLLTLRITPRRPLDHKPRHRLPVFSPPRHPLGEAPDAPPAPPHPLF